MIKKIFLVLLISLLFFSCSKKDGSKIVIASDATWPPMEYVDENKNLVGFDIDFLNAVADAAGFEIEIKNVAWDGIFAGLANGSYDAVCSSVTITEERKGSMDFSMPYVNAGQVLIVPADLEGVETLDQLKGKEVGAQIGTTGALEIEKADGVTLKSYDEFGLAVEDLANGRIAGAVADTPIAADYVLQNETYKGKLKIVGTSFTEENYGIAVKKGNEKVLALLNEGIKKIEESGKLEELKDKWLR